MKFKITVTPEDYINFNMCYLKTSSTLSKTINKSRWLLMALLLLILSFLLIFTDDFAFKVIVSAVVLLGAPIAYIKFPGLVEKQTLKNFRQQINEGKAPYPCDYELTVNNDSFLMKSDKVTEEIGFHDIERIEYTDEAIYLFLNSIKAVILPYRDLQQLDDRDALLSLIKDLEKML